MAEETEQLAQRTIEVTHLSDLTELRRISKATALAIGFGEPESEEIVLVVSELASNLVKHATRGTLTLTPINSGGRSGIQIDSLDRGPGIADVEQAMSDGFSTTGSLGYGLGTVNRLMDDLNITSHPGEGTHIVCQRWVRHDELCLPSPLAFGVATRPRPALEINGDAFVVKQWGESALTGVIDGLGHGQWAHRAAQTARRYVESHFDQPLAEIFQGVGRACRPTRGVVMALARFDWAQEKLTFASIGNIEARIFNSSEPISLRVRRGIIGLNAPKPVVTEHHWRAGNIMVLHSDGVSTHWGWDDFPELSKEPATAIAQRLLHSLAKDEDDATVVVVRDKLE